MTENWYLVLGLEFDPPVTDEAEIKKAIEDKKKWWSRNAQDFKKGPIYKNYLSCAEKGIIEKEILGPEQQMMIEAAQKETYGEIDKKIKTVGMKKEEIPEDTVIKLAQKLKKPEDLVRRRVAALGYKIGAAKKAEDSDVILQKYLNAPDGADRFKGAEAYLQSFHAENLYDFLFADANPKPVNPASLPYKDLNSLAAKLKTERYSKTDALSGPGSKLCQMCIDKAFCDDTAKKAYDGYLGYMQRKKILDEALEIADLQAEPMGTGPDGKPVMVKKLGPENVTDSITKMTAVLKNPTEAKKLFLAFCAKNGISVGAAGDAQSANPHIKYCRCGFSNDTSDGKTRCSACGLELKIKCPMCGKLQDNNANYCDCGYSFAGIDQAMALCDLASAEIDRMEFDVARIHIADAEEKYPGYDKINELKNRLAKKEAQIGSFINKLKEAANEKRYYEARKQYEEIRRIAPEYKDDDLEKRIQMAIRDAEILKNKAESAKNEDEILRYCTQAMDLCADITGIRELLTKFPPAPAEELSVICNAGSGVNALAWKASKTAGNVIYHILRKEGTKPVSVGDGYLVGKVSSCNINDNSVQAGVGYYYAIFTERGGIFSDPLCSDKPIANYSEVPDVKLTALDAEIQLSWGVIADNAKVVIQRESNGNVQQLECNSRSGYLDKGLENEQEYSYRIILRYSDGVQEIQTKGVVVSGMPTTPPPIVERLIVKPDGDESYQAEWTVNGTGEVSLYYSTERPAFSEGDTVSVSDLERAMSPMALTKRAGNGGTFRYTSDNPIFIMGVVVKSGSVTAGAIARISRGGAVKIRSASMVNNRLMILIEQPKDPVTAFIVLYRHDQYPEDLSDTRSKRKRITWKQFEYDSGLVMDPDGEGDYYISVFSETRNGMEADYSVATDVFFSNAAKTTITYSISVVKKLFGAPSASIRFSADREDFMLPAIDIMSGTGALPMFKKSATFVQEIPEQQVHGSLNVSINLGKSVAKKTFLKPFYQDETLQATNPLKPDAKSVAQIS